MNHPNLFSYATSELSQDALICWLLSWASPDCGNSDKDLHECATRLIKSLFAKHGKKCPSIKKIEIEKQYKNIDVLCIVNDTYCILIEDKVGTQNHSDQLDRYRKEVRKIVKEPKLQEENIIPIYFKTGDQSDYSEIEKQEYTPFLRKDFLEVLKTYQGKNAILVDYKDRLEYIQQKTESYKTTEISNWDDYSWTGFYMELQERFEDGNWDYVANPSGGFLGFWWCSQGNDECEQYLQLEQDKLCFKVRVKNRDHRKELRDKWHQSIKDKGPSKGLDLVKPPRFGYGEHMTVCLFNGEYRDSGNGMINLEKTVCRLKKAGELLTSAILASGVAHGQT